MSSDWNPALYRRFEDERTRPALDLLARVPVTDPARVFDLGCGPGNSTELLAARFPNARIVGTDSSEAMLESARERLPGCRFEQSDAASWQPAAAPDLIFANALLQWLPDHETLVPRLFSLLAPGGVLALQMPDNLEEPSHRAMRDVATQGPWAHALGDAARVRAAILPAEGYYDLLVSAAARVEIWRTTYQHPMADAQAIVEWLRATGLRPFLEPLSAAERTEFLAEYTAQIARAYPARRDGRRLLAFPRLFIVAERA
ncbi:MAG TPA: trans-aconitate 2-methyltransferase [Polyangiaceae bacterium]|jgi:trans-aconitate 2-methyltransferase|nr:trans-aconitate 2-methyltransferase [Polyangiaceae bacterium]